MNMTKLLYKTFLIIFIILSQAHFAIANKILHHSSNEYGPLWIFDQPDNSRCLSFVPLTDGIVQTCINLDNKDVIKFEYAKMILGTLYLNDSNKRILMIGLGGGALARTIQQILPNSRLDLVEINPAIPPIAEKYFSFKPNKNTKIFVADGFDFILNSKPETYDIIIIDAFDKYYIPDSFLTLEFVKKIKTTLSKNGVVAINTFVGSIYYETESALYKEVFGEFFNLTNSVSRIIIAKKGDLPRMAKIRKESDKWAFSFTRLGIEKDWLLNKFIKQN